MASKADDNIGPSRVLGNSGPAWAIYVLVFFIAIGLGGGLWYVLAPESMARTFGSLNKDPLNIESLSLTLDRRVVEIPPNGAIEVHPAQTFGIAGLNSNRWQNYDLRLTSQDIDISAITDDSTSTVRDLLPGESFENTREIHITVFDGDEEAADFRILSRYSALDFMARGDAADNNPEAQARYYQKAYQLEPDSGLIRDKLTAALAELGKTKGVQAASIYETLLSQDGPDEQMMSRLAEVYESENKNERLIPLLGQLIEHVEANGGSSRPYRQRLAEAEARAGRLQEAAAVYEKLLVGATTSDKVAILRRLADIYRQGRDSEHEIGALQRLVEIAPPEQVPEILTDIAILYEDSGDSEERLTAWKTLAEKLPDGEPKASVYKIIGMTLAKENKYGQARDFYQAALKIQPKDTNALMNLARLALLENNDKDYIANLSKAVDLDPENQEYRRELAGALAAAKQNAKAKEQYQWLLERAPDDQNLRLTYIGFLDKLDKAEDKKALIQQYQALAERNADNKVIPYNIGDLHFQLREWDKAIESFQKVLKMDPEDLEAREYLLATYQRKNQRADILREALEIYKRNPSKTDYRTLMLNTNENAKDWEGFAKVAKAITEVEPENAYGWEQLHKAQTQLKQSEAAAESLWQVAARTKDKPAGAWLKAAEAFARLKQKDKAVKAYQKVQEIDPENKQAAKGLADLSK